jgi:nucleoside-diphosphate-sugar epimerase
VVLGAGNWKEGSAAIFYKLHQGLQFYPMGNGGFVDVRDVARLAIRVMEEEGYFRLLTTGHTVRYKELFNEISKRIGRRPPSIYAGPLLSEVVWRLLVPVKWLTGRQPAINKETARAAQCITEYDNALSLQVRGFSYTPLEQTLDDIAERFLDARRKKFQPAILDFTAEHLA